MASAIGTMLLVRPSQSLVITASIACLPRQHQSRNGGSFLVSKLQVRKSGACSVKARTCGLRERRRDCAVAASAGAGGLPLEGPADGDSELEVSPPGNPSPQEQEVWFLR